MAQTTREVYDGHGNLISTETVTIPDSIVNLDTLHQKAMAALTNNATYLGIANPTNAQAVAQVTALTRQVNGIIRILLNQTDIITDS